VTEYPVKRVSFNNVRNLTLFVSENWSGGDEETSKLWYIGFKGEWTELKDAPLITVYEVPLPFLSNSINADSGLRKSRGPQETTHRERSELWFGSLNRFRLIKTIAGRGEISIAGKSHKGDSTGINEIFISINLSHISIQQVLQLLAQ